MDVEHLILLIGGVTVMLYGTGRLKESLQRLAGKRLKGLIATLSGNRFSAMGAGAGSTFVFQSSGATTSILVGFAAAGLVTLEQAMAVLLGANIGTTFTVQILAFKVTDYALLIVTVGFLVERIARRTRMRAMGGILFGFGFVFYGIALMGASTAGLRDHPWFVLVLQSFSDQPYLGVLFGAVATAVFQSSAATLAVIIPFAESGTLGLDASVPLVLGANIGTCSMAFIASMGEGTDAKRVAWAHILMKIASVLLILPFLAPFEELGRMSAASGGRQVANLHTFFNIGTAIVFLPIIPFGRRLLEWLIAARDTSSRFGSRYLDARSLDKPALAFGHVTLEIHRMAEIAHTMLRDCIRPFESDDQDIIDDLMDRDQKIDILEREVKLYLARINQQGMSPEDAQLSLDLFATATDLETVGDIVTKNICHLGRKRVQSGGRFTDEGIEELRRLHDAVCANFQVAMAAFTLRDRTLAAKVIREKRKLRHTEEKLRESHFHRLSDGRLDTVATTGIHLDLVANLLLANSSFTRMAYRITRDETAQAEAEDE